MSVKKVTKKVEAKKVEVKKVEKKTSEKEVKKEIAYKQLIWFVPRIVKYVEEWKNATILNDKAVVYAKLLNLLYTSVYMMLNQNLNTYTNSLYINDILSPELQTLRKKYHDSRESLYLKVWWRDKYEAMTNKINAAISKLWDPTKIKNPTKEQKDLLKLIEQNSKLRQQVSSVIDLRKELQKKRSNNLKQKHVLEIYQLAVAPILNFLSKEKEINQKDLQDLDKLIKAYVKDWTLQLKDINFWIKVKYWPKEAVYWNWKQFWYRWVIWNQFQEFVLWKEWKWVIDINSWKEYIDIFKENMIYEKEKLSNEWIKVPEKQLFYPYFRWLILSDHIKMQKMMKKFVESLKVKLEKSKKVDKEVIQWLEEISHRMIIWKMELEVTRKWEKCVIKIQNDKTKKEEVKKWTPKKVSKKK